MNTSVYQHPDQETEHRRGPPHIRQSLPDPHSRVTTELPCNRLMLPVFMFSCLVSFAQHYVL